MNLTIDLKRGMDLGIKHEVVLSFIENNPGCTQKRVAEYIKVSQRTIFDIVEDLIEKDLVEKSGWYLYSK